MRKNKLTLISLIAIIIALSFIAIKKPSTEETADTSDVESTSVKVVENDFANLKGVNISNLSGTYEFTLTQEEDSENWSLNGTDVPLNDEISSFAHGATTIISNDVIKDANPEDYGIDKKTYGEVIYKDGTKNKIYIGNPTPDKYYYYAQLDGDPNIYFLSRVTAERYSYRLNDFIVKDLGKPTEEAYASIDKFSVTYPEGDNFVVASEGTSEEAKEQFETYGSLVLNMVEPIKGRSVYFEKVIENIITPMPSEFGNLVEANPTDLSLYGLDTPSATINFHYLDATENTIQIGKILESGKGYYATKKGVNAVFELSGIEAFFNINALSYIDRFVNLENIVDVESVIVTTSTTSYNLKMNHSIEGEGEDAKDIMAPTLNNVDVDEDKFKDLYQVLIALSIDGVVEELKPEYLGDSQLTVTYNLLDGTTTSTNYLPYSDTFYGVSQNGEPVQFISNIQDVNFLLEQLEKLKNGEELDIQ
ncbi:MAG: DUF4340 domain-containing protein [Lachnospirales bacterium]